MFLQGLSKGRQSLVKGSAKSHQSIFKASSRCHLGVIKASSRQNSRGHSSLDKASSRHYSKFINDSSRSNQGVIKATSKLFEALSSLFHSFCYSLTRASFKFLRAYSQPHQSIPQVSSRTYQIFITASPNPYQISTNLQQQ